MLCSNSAYLWETTSCVLDGVILFELLKDEAIKSMKCLKDIFIPGIFLCNMFSDQFDWSSHCSIIIIIIIIEMDIIITIAIINKANSNVTPVCCVLMFL